MSGYFGLYKASCVAVDGDVVRILVPQLFADMVTEAGGVVQSPPNSGDEGWVAFASGDLAYPVWVGSAWP